MLHKNFSLWQTSRACATKIVHTGLCYNNASCHTHGKLWPLRKHIMPHVKRRNQQVDCSDFAPPAIQKGGFFHVQWSRHAFRLAFRLAQATWICRTRKWSYALSRVHPIRGKNAASVLILVFIVTSKPDSPSPLDRANEQHYFKTVQYCIGHSSSTVTYSILISSVVIYLLKCYFDTTCSWILVQIHCKRLSFRWCRALYMPNFWPSTIKSLNVNEDLD